MKFQPDLKSGWAIRERKTIKLEEKKTEKCKFQAVSCRSFDFGYTCSDQNLKILDGLWVMALFLWFIFCEISENFKHSQKSSTLPAPTYLTQIFPPEKCNFAMNKKNCNKFIELNI